MIATLNVLGSSAAIPTPSRSPSSQILELNGEYVMLDCGEATQMKIMDYGLKASKLTKIFITHLHGDHFFGLPGLLSSMALQGRRDQLTLIGPKGLKKFIRTAFESIGSKSPFEMRYLELTEKKTRELEICDNWKVIAQPLNHRISTYGYIFQSRPTERHLIPDKYFAYNLGYEKIPMVKAGKNVSTDDGKTVDYREVTTPPDPPLSYAYITDTDYIPDLYESLSEVTVLYHEATFMHNNKERARRTKHTTAKEAATIAKKAAVKDLLIGHFSVRYLDVGKLTREAQAVFPATHAVREGKEYRFDHNGILPESLTKK